METLAGLAAHLDDVAEAMARAGAALAGLTGPVGAVGEGRGALDRDGTAFAEAAPGRLGETGRALHFQLVDAIGARSHEAVVAGARLADAAQALRWAAIGYLDADSSARSRLVPPTDGLAGPDGEVA